jgi:hypothetical protein
LDYAGGFSQHEKSPTEKRSNTNNKFAGGNSCIEKSPTGINLTLPMLI